MDKETVIKLSSMLHQVLDQLEEALGNPALTPQEFAEELSAYIGRYESIPSRDDPEAFKEALKNGTPVMVGKGISVSLRGLLPYIQARWRKISDRKLIALLKEIGAVQKSVYARRGGDWTLIGKRYWLLPKEINPKKPSTSDEGGELFDSLENLTNVSIKELVEAAKRL